MHIPEHLDITTLYQETSKQAVDVIISALTDSLVGGDRVTLVGFGTFQVMERKARRGINPQTRKAMNIPAKRVPKFVPGKSLREKVK